MWRVWAPTGQQTCTRVPQSALLMPPGHLLARVLVGGPRRAAVALRRAALQAQRQASGGTDPFRGRWTWRLLLRCDCRERRSLWPRDFAKPEVAYCANGSVGAQEKQRGSQRSLNARKGGIVGTPSAGWASGAMWWPLGCIVGCWRKLNMVIQLNHWFLGGLISEAPTFRHVYELRSAS